MAGVIGLGEVGAGVSLCLARVGMLAAVYDVRRDAATGLDGVPAVAASPAEVARQADVVIIAVVDSQQTIEVLSGAHGVLSASRPGASVILLSTVSLPDLARIRVLTDAAGVALIDSGVAAGGRSAQKGIISLVGATDEDLEKVRPVLEGFSKYVAHMGGPGAGMAAKIARNAIVMGAIRAGYEGTELAKAAGVDVRRFVEVMEDAVDAVTGPTAVARRPGDPSVDVVEARMRERMRKFMVKDMDAALDLGRTLGIRLPVVEIARETSFEVVGLPPKT